MKNLQSYDEFLNEDRIKPGDPGYADNFFANMQSLYVYDDLNNSKGSPIEIISKWASKLSKTDKFTPEQIEDLKKEALALRGISSGPKYKQLMKDKIIKTLKGEKIR